MTGVRTAALPFPRVGFDPASSRRTDSVGVGVRAGDVLLHAHAISASGRSPADRPGLDDRGVMPDPGNSKGAAQDVGSIALGT